MTPHSDPLHNDLEYVDGIAVGHNHHLISVCFDTSNGKYHLQYVVNCFEFKPDAKALLTKDFIKNITSRSVNAATRRTAINQHKKFMDTVFSSQLEENGFAKDAYKPGISFNFTLDQNSDYEIDDVYLTPVLAKKDVLLDTPRLQQELFKKPKCNLELHVWHQAMQRVSGKTLTAHDLIDVIYGKAKKQSADFAAQNGIQAIMRLEKGTLNKTKSGLVATNNVPDGLKNATLSVCNNHNDAGKLNGALLYYFMTTRQSLLTTREAQALADICHEMNKMTNDKPLHHRPQ